MLLHILSIICVSCGLAFAQDRALPPAPSELSVAPVSESQNDVTWKESAGAVGYKVHRDGLYLAAPKTPLLSDRGLKADTSYCYAVSAVDLNGAESGITKEVCAKTRASGEGQMQTGMAGGTLEKQLREKGRALIDIEFDYNQATVRRQYHKQIRKFADIIRANPALVVVIEGHTDSRGSKDYNLRLSRKRAESVRDFMIKQLSVPAARLKATGYGTSKPIAGNETTEGRQKNRRVEAAIDQTAKRIMGR